MKNTIIIEVDTDKEQAITFSKTSEFTPPETKEQAAAVVLNDIACLSEAITTLILLASQNGYGDKKELIEASTKTIESLLGPDNIELSNETNEH